MYTRKILFAYICGCSKFVLKNVMLANVALLVNDSIEVLSAI